MIHQWNWPTVDAGRADRAKKEKIISKDLNADNPSLIIKGSGGEYRATLSHCTCKDFSINANKGEPIACKHMVRLAMELGILNANGLTADEQRQVDISNLETRLALYAWHYYVLNSPDVSDKEYDALKTQYLDLIE